jgi:LysM repeat protein
MNSHPLSLVRALTLICIVALAAALVVVSGQAAAAPTAQGGTPTLTGLQPANHNGGLFKCDGWTVEIPPNVVPDGSFVHCGAFNPFIAPAAPGGFSLLRHTININIYNNKGEWVTKFNPPLKFCYTYSDADLTAAGGDARKFTVASAPIDGQWSVTLTSITPDTRQACANTDHLTLFDLAVSGAAAVSGSPASSAAATATASSASVTYRYVTFTYAYKYTVQPGDNLFRIALKFNTTVAAIQAANGLGSNSIFVGQQLIIPTNTLFSGAATTATPVVTTPKASVTLAASTTTAPRQTTYIVQRGDNLFRIALKFNTTVAAIQAANGLTGTNILVGQKLIIPGK